MKKLIPFLILLFFFVNTQAQKKFTVKNAQEFIDAIGSNRTILLKPGTYVLSDLRDARGNEHVYLEEGHEGFEVYIRNVKNLTIKSKGKIKAELITAPRYGQVLIMENCKNISFERIIAGHGPEKGYCTGGVLAFRDCKGMNIKGCVLYGSGTYGIESSQSKNLNVEGTTIKECTYGIMLLYQSKNVSFKDCFFKNNEEFGLVILEDIENASFENCTFKGNETGDYEGYLFQISGKYPAIIKDCSFNENYTMYLANKESHIEFIDCTFKENEFRKGEYKEE